MKDLKNLTMLIFVLIAMGSSASDLYVQGEDLELFSWVASIPNGTSKTLSSEELNEVNIDVGLKLYSWDDLFRYINIQDEFAEQLAEREDVWCDSVITFQYPLSLEEFLAFLKDHESRSLKMETFEAHCSTAERQAISIGGAYNQAIMDSNLNLLNQKLSSDLLSYIDEVVEIYAGNYSGIEFQGITAIEAKLNINKYESLIKESEIFCIDLVRSHLRRSLIGRSERGDGRTMSTIIRNNPNIQLDVNVDDVYWIRRALENEEDIAPPEDRGRDIPDWLICRNDAAGRHCWFSPNSYHNCMYKPYPHPYRNASAQNQKWTSVWRMRIAAGYGFRFTTDARDRNNHMSATNWYHSDYPWPKYDRDDDDGNGSWEEAELTSQHPYFPTKNHQYHCYLGFTKPHSGSSGRVDMTTQLCLWFYGDGEWGWQTIFYDTLSNLSYSGGDFWGSNSCN